MDSGFLAEALDTKGKTSQEALENQDLDYDVTLRPVATYVSVEGKKIRRTCEENRAVVRMSDYEPLSVVGLNYRPIQHREAFGALDQMVYEGRHVIEKVQSIKGGKKVMVVSRSLEGMTIAGEPITRYGAWLNGHDGKTPVIFVPVPSRDFCSNVLRGLGYHRDDSYKIRHTKTAPARLMEAQELMFGNGGAHEYDLENELQEVIESQSKKMEEEAAGVAGMEERFASRVKAIGEKFATHKVDNRGFERFIKQLVPIEDAMSPKAITTREEKRGDIRALWMSEPNLNNIRFTLWGIYNTVVQFTDHYKDYKSQDNRVLNILDGRNDNLKAYNILAEMSGSKG